MVLAFLGAKIPLGEVDGQPTEKLGRVESLFEQAEQQPDLLDDILHWLWLHSAMSTGIWAGSAKHREVKPFLRDSILLKQCCAATRETIELCRLHGVDPEKYPKTKTFNLPTWLFIILFRLLYTTNWRAHFVASGWLTAETE
jgi:ketopantoate reductase